MYIFFILFFLLLAITKFVTNNNEVFTYDVKFCFNREQIVTKFVILAWVSNFIFYSNRIGHI